jgi:chromosomal replication initiator protein
MTDPSITMIQTEVSAYFGLPLIEMRSDRLARRVTRPRQIAMFLACKMTPRSLPAIGRSFGDRDHTTVMHAVKRVTSLCEHDPAIARDVALLRQRIENPDQLTMAV